MHDSNVWSLSKDTLTTKYNFYLEQIALLCWSNSTDNDTNPATFQSSIWSPFVYGSLTSDSYLSWWIINKIDPTYDAYRRQKSSMKVVLAINMYAFMKYDARLSPWRVFSARYSRDHVRETTFGDEMLQNLLNTFTVHGLWHSTGGEHTDRTYTHEAG